MAKRSNGEGSIVRSGGKYLVFYSPPGQLNANGNPKRIKRTRATRKLAAAELDRLRLEYADGGVSIEHAEMATSEYLKHWLETVIKPNREPNTYNAYEAPLRNHVIPAIGRTKLGQIKPAAIQRMLAEIRNSNAGNGKTGGGRAAENAYTVLTTSLNKAVQWGWLRENPCGAVDKPKCDAQPIVPFTVEQAKQIMTATAGTESHAICVLGFCCGLRIGELCGLHKADILWDTGELNIHQQLCEVKGQSLSLRPPKFGSSRYVTLPSIAATALRDHLSMMTERGHQDIPQVFCSARGRWLRREKFSKTHWHPLLRDLGLQPRGFHHVRHSYATNAIAANVPITEVSKTLGHSKVSITVDIYNHWIDRHATRASALIDSLYGADNSSQPG